MPESPFVHDTTLLVSKVVFLNLLRKRAVIIRLKTILKEQSVSLKGNSIKHKANSKNNTEVALLIVVILSVLVSSLLYVV